VSHVGSAIGNSRSNAAKVVGGSTMQKPTREKRRPTGMPRPGDPLSALENRSTNKKKKRAAINAS